MKQSENKINARYHVYILECADNTLYTGITNDLDKRVLAHNSSKTGAKYTRSRRPVVLRYSRRFNSKSEALKKEAALKNLTRQEKLALILVKPKLRRPKAKILKK